MESEICNLGKTGNLSGIFTHSVNQKNINTCVIFLNAGLIHKIGPNGLHVKISGRLSINGLSSFRFDFSGIGDSYSNNSRDCGENNKIDEVRGVMDALQRKYNIENFILFGICTGAEDAFKVAQYDNRIVGLSLIDGVFQEKTLLEEVNRIALRNCAIRYYKKNIVNINRWLKVIKGRSSLFSRANLKYLYKIIVLYLKRIIRLNKDKNLEVKSTGFDVLEWKNLIDRNVKIQLMFCEGSSAIDIFNLTIASQMRNIIKDNIIEYSYIKDVDHTFTPIWSQILLEKRFVNWLKYNFLN